MRPSNYSQVADIMSPLGHKLLGVFEEAERQRVEVEQRWLQDLRQYKGQYDPEIERKMHPKRSRVFLRTTRLKVETFTRLMLAVALGSKDKNWELEPTPNPQVSEVDKIALAQSLQQKFAELGVPPQPEDFEAAVRELARRRAVNMSREIQDQLDGNEDRRYSDLMRHCIKSGNLYGTGILKGPLIEVKDRTRWTRTENDWTSETVQELLPYLEFVPVWNCYPDMAAQDIRDARYIFERHVFSKPDLLDLAKREDFDGAKIKDYIRAYPQGTADDFKTFETQLQGLSQDTVAQPKRERRYELLEYWGLLSAEELREVGVEIEGDDTSDVWAQVWLLGPVVIKATLQPLEGTKLPYYFYYYDKDETSIWGEGIPALTRDPQAILNSAMRIMLDNAAIACGPQIEVNADLLDSGEDPTDIHPFRVWVRLGRNPEEAAVPAVRVTAIPAMLQEVEGILKLGEVFMDEVSGVPRIDMGDEKVGQAAQTATGLSMLMQRSNSMITEQLLRYDDEVTRPTIAALYQWNMQFNDKPDIKGDFAIKARGMAGVQAKELRAQQLMQFLAMVAPDPEMRQMIHMPKVVRQIATNLDVSEDVVKDEDEIQAPQTAVEQIIPAVQQQGQAIQQLAQMVQQLGQQLQAGDPMKAQALAQQMELDKAKLAGELQLKKEKVEGELAIKQAKTLGEVQSNAYADELQRNREASVAQTGKGQPASTAPQRFIAPRNGLPTLIPRQTR